MQYKKKNIYKIHKPNDFYIVLSGNPPSFTTTQTSVAIPDHYTVGTSVMPFAFADDDFADFVTLDSETTWKNSILDPDDSFHFDDQSRA